MAVHRRRLAEDRPCAIGAAVEVSYCSPDVIGETVGGRYKITRQLSSGGMGVICEAVHEATGRKVALKIIRNSAALGEDQDAWFARFKREARAAGSIDTPHITQVFDAATDAATGQPFIAMELLTGRDVSKSLKAVGPLPPETALKIVAQACIGLARAHDAGVIHRDIKPGNIFLAEQEQDITVKLVDFGIAKVVTDDGTNDGAELTQTGSLLGTPTYMSPEQAKGMKSIDHRADIWALGVVLYKMLSNVVPHPKREGLGQLIVAICTEPAPPVQSHAPWVPAGVARILERALRIDPDQRYQSADELRQAVEELLPRGRALTVSEVRALTEAERAHVAPRYTSAFPPAAVDPPDMHAGHEASGTQPGFVQPTSGQVRSKRFPLAVTAAVLGASLAVGSVLLYTSGSKPTPAKAEDTGSSAPSPAPPASARPSPRVTVTVTVPPGTQARVNGRGVSVVEGKVELEGTLGQTLPVELIGEGSRKEWSVAITEEGARPSELTLPAPPGPTAKSDRSPPVVRQRPATRPQPAPAGPSPKKTPGVGVVESFE